MNSKQTITIMAIAMIAFGMIAATTTASPDDASAQKPCAAKEWSNGKGGGHWYTKKGHHHCFKGEKGCIYFEY